MARHVLLNNVEHGSLRVITERGAKYGDKVWYALTFPSEFRAVQSCFPIFFQKSTDTGKFFAVALFGFEEGENLYLNDAGWAATYVPMTLLRQPFLIGRQKVIEESIETERRVVHIDLDNPRVSTTEGEPLFQEFGGNSPFLDRMADVLEHIHQGIGEADHFIDTLLMHELLEPFTLDIELNDGSKNQLVGFYAINEDRLKQLGDDVVISLHRLGYWEPIYMALGSQSHISYLVEARNRRLSADSD